MQNKRALHRSRAEYLEALAGRVLRSTRRRIPDREALDAVTSLTANILLEFGALERHCADLEHAAASAAQRRRNLLSAIPLPCIITDDRSLIVEANPEALGILHESERRMIGKPVDLWLHTRPPDAAVPAMLRWLREQPRPYVRLAPRGRRPVDMALVIQPVEGTETPLWRWFFLASAVPDAAPVGG
jgi:PAS domain-containing protein